MFFICRGDACVAQAGHAPPLQIPEVLMKKRAAIPVFMLSRLSRTIQSRREFLDMTQEDLSVKTGLHRTYISDIERGARNVSLKNLSRLATALELPTSTLIKLTELDASGRTQFQTAETQLRDLYENAPCGYHCVDKDGTFIRMNTTELEWLGYSREEVVGRLRMRDLLTRQSLSSFEYFIPQFEKVGWLPAIDVEMVRKNGTTMPVLMSANAITDQFGKFVMSRSVVLRRDAEGALDLDSEPIGDNNVAQMAQRL
jgi:PAS domain S-box-containing protein